MSETKHYVTFFYPGAFFAEESTVAVDSRDPAAVAVPETAFAFEFFDREEADVNGEVLRGAPKNRSGRYYPGGRLMDVADILVFEPNNSILVANMQANQWEHVVRTRAGNYQPFKENDVLVAAHG